MPIRVTGLVKRRPDLTQEQFSKYWSETHGAIFTSLKACNIHLISYNQFHVVPEHTDALASAGIPIAPYDGAADFEVEKLEDLLALFGDSEYQQKAVPDEINFLDRASVVVMVGENKPKFKKE